MNVVKVNDKQILCSRDLGYPVCSINRELLKLIPEEDAVVEMRWGRKIKTYEYKGQLYIPEIALGLDDTDYDEKYVGLEVMY